MTISSETRKAGPFTGDGSNTSFPFAFKVFASSDLRVVHTDADGVETDLVLDSDYSVSLNADQNADPGGTVTYPISGTALPSTETLTVLSAVPYTQETDITNGGGFYPNVVENALDKLTIHIQQVREMIGRSVLLPVATGLSDIALPAPGAGQYIRWNNAGTALEAVSSTVSSGTFLQSGTGAVTREANAKMGEIVSSADFDATGDGTATDTTAIQNALNAAAGGTLLIKKPTVAYKVGPLTMPSNCMIWIEPGTVFEAVTGYGLTDVMLDFDGVSNLTMWCEGVTFQGLKTEYVSGEHRHIFNLVDCSNVTIHGGSADDSGGDGYYINGATDLTMYRPIADNNRRNGMSIIKGARVTVYKPYLKNSAGTAPQAGLVIEPNGATDDLVDINIIEPVSEDNTAQGYVIFLDDYSAGSPADVGIRITNPVSRSNGQEGYRLRNLFLSSGSYDGYIDIINPVSIDDGYNGLYMLDVGLSGPQVRIINPKIINPNSAGSATFPRYVGAYIADDSSTASGRIEVSNLSVTDANASMQYGLWVEAGGGYDGLKISVNEITGATQYPVRFANFTASTTGTYDIALPRKRTRALAATADLYSYHSGELITNSGASGTVVYSLREYLPVGHSYRVRVVANQTVRVDTYTAGDQIVGTSASGKYAECSTVGGEAEFVYIGSQLWQIRPISGTWTFEP